MHALIYPVLAAGIVFFTLEAAAAVNDHEPTLMPDARWIGYDLGRDDPYPQPVLLRTSFDLSRPVREATLTCTALGVADFYLNGRRVSEDRFNPGWTDYHQRVYARTYDVTGLVADGANALGAVLADGWFAGHVGWGNHRNHYGTRPRIMARLDVVYADGSVASCTTGPGWRAAAGPWQQADMQDGEIYDARKERDGWSAPGYDDTGWVPVDSGCDLAPRVEPHPAPPVRVFEELAPVGITRPHSSGYIVDFGRNFAGVVRIKVRGPRGRMIRLRHGEMLDANGALYTANLRGADATDAYICRGDGEETWEPRFTFHGFRYLEVQGLDRADPSMFTGLAIGSDTPRIGHFESSHAVLDTLVENVYRTQRANFISVPTDCPQRDERLGWTGDAQVFIGAATYLCDVQDFFRKWMVDLADSQHDGGAIPSVAPAPVVNHPGGAAWEDAAVICPWTLYQAYGDREDLARAWPMMRDLVAYKRTTFDSSFRPVDDVRCYGDWLNLDDPTPKTIIRLAYMIHSADLAAQAALVLAHEDDAARFKGYAAGAREAFARLYLQPDGRIMDEGEGDSQTAYALAVAYDCLPPDAGAEAGRHLVRKLEERGVHLSTGFVGTCILLEALTKIGRNDLAYRVLLNESYPGWLFPVVQGATSIWEHWDGWTPEGGFQHPKMNSFSHYAYGAVYQWMVEHIGGLQHRAPGRGAIEFRPDLPPAGSEAAARLWHATVRLEVPAGPVVSSWRREGGTVHYRFIVPDGVHASASVAREPAGRLEGDLPGGHQERDGRLVFDLAPGTWTVTTE